MTRCLPILLGLDTPNTARGLPKSTNRKKVQPRSIPALLDNDLSELEDDDGNVIMTNTTASNRHAKGNGKNPLFMT